VNRLRSWRNNLVELAESMAPMVADSRTRASVDRQWSFAGRLAGYAVPNA
jgi:hypothetical protein